MRSSCASIALGLLLSLSHGASAQDEAPPASPAKDTAVSPPKGTPVSPGLDTSLSAGDVVVQTLGGGDAKILLVDHGDCWSMHAENVLAQDIFRLWHEVGGPAVEMKTPLDFPFTLSVHRMGTERLVDRILEGWGRTLHFDAKGRLELVRTYSPKPARLFKTPRLVESLGTWRQVETAKPTHPDGTPERTVDAPPPVVVAPAPAAPPRPVPVPEPVDDPMAQDPTE